MSRVKILFKRHVQGTKKKAVVESGTILLCTLSRNQIRALEQMHREVFINTRVIKHLYDKRPAQEFDFMLEYLESVLKYPARIYRNKAGKRGQYCFIKRIKETLCLCSIELNNEENHMPQWEVVTFFTINQEYLKNYELLWKRKDDVPSS